MKEIKFRPLRVIKKTGKITVASYMQWRKVMIANQQAGYASEEFNLILYKDFLDYPFKERVYNHKGELLFWYDHKNLEAIPKNFIDMELVDNYLFDYLDGETWKLSEPIGRGFHYSIQGFDCDGVPVFSHYTLDYIGRMDMDVLKFEILTVETILKWYGWFLWQLNNSNLTK